ncbi:MAG TPA: allantoinase AllB [Thermodesulfobacteriota bacterium]|nr:allantoinase AllB [Thermodesulfobacteriota bacterium]
MADLVIKNGTVVTSQGSFEGGIGVENGRIVAIGSDQTLPKAQETLDATGLHILPGVIDDHVHFREPGMTYKEDFETGSRAAAFGGVTTVFDMPNTSPPLIDVKNLREKVALVKGRSYVDFAFYAAVTDSNVDQLKPLAEAGIGGFKVFMGETTGYIRCPNDGLIYEAFKRIKETGLRVGAHAENDAILQHIKARLVAEGRKDPIAHLESRPSFAEAEAISRAILLSEAVGNCFHVFHLSTREGLNLVREARLRGLPITAEVLVSHLLLDESDYERIGNLIRLNPPIRTQEHQRAMWEGLRQGWIDNIATDHAPHSYVEKTAESVWDTACGFIGVETALPLMLTEVNRGRLTLEHYVRLVSENPARVWGIYPRKGAIQIGSDGDFVLVDLKAEKKIESSKLHNKNTLTPYEGRAVKGLPRYTILRGKIIMAEGEVIGSPAGEWVRPE